MEISAEHTDLKKDKGPENSLFGHCKLQSQFWNKDSDVSDHIASDLTTSRASKEPTGYMCHVITQLLSCFVLTN